VPVDDPVPVEDPDNEDVGELVVDGVWDPEPVPDPD